jgi:hypothetical protein
MGLRDDGSPRALGQDQLNALLRDPQSPCLLRAPNPLEHPDIDLPTCTHNRANGIPLSLEVLDLLQPLEELRLVV